MNQSSTFAVCEGRYELRFISLFNRGRGYAFPCDSEGHVEIDDLSDRGRSNYFYARVVVGHELSVPTVALVARSIALDVASPTHATARTGRRGLTAALRNLCRLKIATGLLPRPSPLGPDAKPAISRP